MIYLIAIPLAGCIVGLGVMVAWYRSGEREAIRKCNLATIDRDAWRDGWYQLEIRAMKAEDELYTIQSRRSQAVSRGNVTRAAKRRVG